MNTASFKYFLLNCMLLLLPIIALNVIFASKLPPAYLPDIFWKDIPPIIANSENGFRLFFFILPILMPLRIDTQSQKIGLWLYIAGIAIYFLSWLAQIYFPQSAWSLSALGFLAPAYTPLIWLIVDRYRVNWKHALLFISLSFMDVHPHINYLYRFPFVACANNLFEKSSIVSRNTKRTIQ